MRNKGKGNKMLELKVRKIGNSLGVVLPRKPSGVCVWVRVTAFS
jgi:hypothetical protein